MSSIRWLIAAAAVLLIGAAMARPSTGSETPTTPVVDDDETPLHVAMEVIEEGLKNLRRGLRKPENNPASLETIVAMQKAALESKGMDPAMTANIPEAERAKFLTSYRKDMAICLKAMLDMEIAVLDGDNDKAQELYKTLKLQEEDGHEKFTEDG